MSSVGLLAICSPLALNHGPLPILSIASEVLELRYARQVLELSGNASKASCVQKASAPARPPRLPPVTGCPVTSTVRLVTKKVMFGSVIVIGIMTPASAVLDVVVVDVIVIPGPGPGPGCMAPSDRTRNPPAFSQAIEIRHTEIAVKYQVFRGPQKDILLFILTALNDELFGVIVNQVFRFLVTYTVSTIRPRAHSLLFISTFIKLGLM